MAHTSLRIPCRSHAEAKELALRLEEDGYRVARRWKAVLARTATIDEAERLAGKLEIVGCLASAPYPQASRLPESPRVHPDAATIREGQAVTS